MSGPRLGCRDTGQLIRPGFFTPRNQIGGVYDGVRIAPGLDDHSDAPLKHWREHLKRKRQREGERNEQKKPPESPAVQEDDKPAGSIDEYA
jgi:hypothetical protein